MSAHGSDIYEFGPFRLDPAERVLLREGQALALNPKGFDLLHVLVRNAGRVVLKKELMREVWPDTFVEENNLTVNISALRKMLEQWSSGHTYIQTVPRRGYRFAATVHHPGGSLPCTQPPSSAGKAGSEILVGREPELRKLEMFLSKAVQGFGGMVFITGEPGIGKTALSNAFLRLVRSRYASAKFSQGRCLEQYGTGEPYLPVLESLSALLTGPDHEFVADVLRSRAPAWCLQFPSVFASDDARERLYRETVGATKERMLREMVDALRALASAAPLVLHFEDLHWADPSSTDLLRRLCQEVGNQRLLVTGTFRPEDVERANRAFNNFLLEAQSHDQYEEIPLDLLNREALETYLNTRFTPNRFDPELPVLIHCKTEGQPLFVTSLVQFLVERGDIARIGEYWTVTRSLSELDLVVPESVRSMIRKKLEVLEEQDRRALLYASVQGEEFLSNVVAESLESDELGLEERLDRLERFHRLIQPCAEEELPDGTVTTRYRFTHSLYQNFLYSDLLTKRRSFLHRQAGESLVRCYGNETARIATALAMHFEYGREFPRAIAYLTQAGDNAAGLFAHNQACDHFTRALELSEKLPDEKRASIQIMLYKKRGDENLLRGLLQNAERDYNSVLAIAIAASDAEWECRALTDLANVHNYARKPEEMAACATEALAIAERIGHHTLSSEAKGQLATSYQVVGRIEEAHRLYDESISAARSLRHVPALLQGLTFRGTAHFFRSEYEAAVTAETEAVELASESRNGFYLALSRTYLGYSLANQGRISEALSSLNGALALARRNENPIVLARAPNGLGWIYREMGILPRAIEYNEACVETARTAGATEAEANALINLVYDYTLVGKASKAAAVMQRVDSLYDRQLWNRWRFYEVRHQAASAEYWLAARKLDRAEEHAHTLLANAQRYGVPKYIAIAHRILGEIADFCGDAISAEEELMNSIEPLQGNPAPLVEWRNHAALGRLLQRSAGRPAAAREAFRRAARLVQKIAASIADSELQSAFLDAADIRQVLSGGA